MNYIICGVYKITNPLGHSYVGSSTNIKKRWITHKSMAKKEQRKLIASFKKHGVENHIFEVIVECEKDELREKEQFFGIQLNVLDDEKGLNCYLPKNGRKEIFMSKSSIKKRSEAQIGKTPWNKGVKMTEKQRENAYRFPKGQDPWNKGKKFSEESKRKMSESSKGIPAWNRQTVLDTETGKSYKSLTEAGEYFGVDRRKLKRMIDFSRGEFGKRLKIIKVKD